MLHRIDHIVILVEDLAAASVDWTRAGFTVIPGGTHAAGLTHNALVTFADGSYFELIAFFHPEEQQEHRWWSRVADGEGLIDYALLSDDLTSDASAARGHGLEVIGPEDGGRLRPDGQHLEWKSMLLGRGIGEPTLPFVIEDVTPRELRVPGGEATQHPLGVTGIAGLILVTNNLDEAATAMTSLLGTPGEDVVVDEGAMLRFTLGEQWIALLQPGDDQSDTGQYLRRRGDGPYEVALRGPADAEGTETALLPLDQTHQVRLRVIR
jgi:hypothetical protein